MRVRALTVEVTKGPDAGQRRELSGRTMTIGTDPGNDLVLSDDSVSRFHCRIAVDTLGIKIVDTRSANGTRTSGLRIGDAYIEDDVRLELGRSELLVALGSSESEIPLYNADSFGGAVGRSVAMRDVFELARRAASSNATTLILGETGTGKDVLARAIHFHSARAQQRFEVFDCGAVAPTLIESALFGHVKGAFTGAEMDMPGVFERAHGGTLFLDEIGELAPDLQPKLLRALESGSITRVGATAPITIDVRIIAATNRDLRTEVESDRFRADLYYRLAVIPIEIPPLRDRPEDIPLLAAHFARHLLAPTPHEFAALRSYIDEAFGALSHYRWSGNARELRNVIERAIALAPPSKAPGKDVFNRMVELRTCIGATMHCRPALKLAREQFDREYLRDVLAACQGDLNKAASIADIHPKSFARLLRRYEISRW